VFLAGLARDADRSSPGVAGLILSQGRCSFSTSDGRRCTALTYPGHASLCHQHLRKELEGLPPAQDVATGILSSIHNFQSAAAINAALGRIFALLAAGRITRQDALSLAYLCQLMLQSLKGFKHEICLTTYEKIFERDLLRVLNAHSARRVGLSAAARGRIRRTGGTTATSGR
jgi:hypothetical protein